MASWVFGLLAGPPSLSLGPLGIIRVLHKITLSILASLLVPAFACAQTEPAPDRLPPAGKLDFGTTVGVIDAALAKYFDVYCQKPTSLSEYHFNFVDQLRADGVVRITLNLPDGSQRTFDADDTLAGGHVEKTELISGTACRLSFRRGDEQTEVFSTAYSHIGRPFTYWVWSRKHP